MLSLFCLLLPFSWVPFWQIVFLFAMLQFTPRAEPHVSLVMEVMEPWQPTQSMTLHMRYQSRVLSSGAGSMVKPALHASKVEPTGLRLTTSPSMEHFSVRSDSVDSLASLDAMHETDSLIPRRPMTLPL